MDLFIYNSYFEKNLKFYHEYKQLKEQFGKE